MDIRDHDVSNQNSYQIPEISEVKTDEVREVKEEKVLSPLEELAEIIQDKFTIILPDKLSSKPLDKKEIIKYLQNCSVLLIGEQHMEEDRIAHAELVKRIQTLWKGNIAILTEDATPKLGTGQLQYVKNLPKDIELLPWDTVKTNINNICLGARLNSAVMICNILNLIVDGHNLANPHSAKFDKGLGREKNWEENLKLLKKALKELETKTLSALNEKIELPVIKEDKFSLSKIIGYKAPAVHPSIEAINTCRAEIAKLFSEIDQILSKTPKEITYLGTHSTEDGIASLCTILEKIEVLQEKLSTLSSNQLSNTNVDRNTGLIENVKLALKNKRKVVLIAGKEHLYLDKDTKIQNDIRQKAINLVYQGLPKGSYMILDTNPTEVKTKEGAPSSKEPTGTQLVRGLRGIQEKIQTAIEEGNFHNAFMVTVSLSDKAVTKLISEYKKEELDMQKLAFAMTKEGFIQKIEEDFKQFKIQLDTYGSYQAALVKDTTEGKKLKEQFESIVRRCVTYGLGEQLSLSNAKSPEEKRVVSVLKEVQTKEIMQFANDVIKHELVSIDTLIKKVEERKIPEIFNEKTCSDINTVCKEISSAIQELETSISLMKELDKSSIQDIEVLEKQIEKYKSIFSHQLMSYLKEGVSYVQKQIKFLEANIDISHSTSEKEEFEKEQHACLEMINTLVHSYTVYNPSQTSNKKILLPPLFWTKTNNLLENSLDHLENVYSYLSKVTSTSNTSQGIHSTDLQQIEEPLFECMQYIVNEYIMQLKNSCKDTVNELQKLIAESPTHELQLKLVEGLMYRIGKLTEKMNELQKKFSIENKGVEDNSVILKQANEWLEKARLELQL